MNDDGLQKMWSILLAVVLSFCGVTGYAQADPQAGSATVAMLTLADYSNDPEAKSIVMPAVERAFADTDSSLLLPHELRTILRKYRIRAVGMIDRAGAEAIALETGVKYLLTGSLDFFENVANPAVGLSIRVIDVSDMRPIYAHSVSITGDQFTGLFGLGHISDIDSLAYRLGCMLAEDVRAFMATFSGIAAGTTSPTIAIVPFDDIEPDDRAGAIASTYLLTQLIEEGIRVIEPGVGRELFLQTGQAPRGEIDYDLIDALRDSLQVDLILTGAVDGFTSQATGAGGSRSELSLGARLIDAHTRRIIAAEYVITSGESGSGLLKGAGFPAGEVMSSALNEIVRKLPIDSQDTIADSLQEEI